MVILDLELALVSVDDPCVYPGLPMDAIPPLPVGERGQRHAHTRPTIEEGRVEPSPEQSQALI
jgi:hypothetical protein